jgi:hypothetical protein
LDRFKLRHLDEIIDTLFDEEMQFLRSALENVADVYMGLPPADPTTQNIN